MRNKLLRNAFDVVFDRNFDEFKSIFSSNEFDINEQDKCTRRNVLLQSLLLKRHGYAKSGG